jgi:class 3 adenylate cyclase
MGKIDTVTATFLMTDIQDSTCLWEQDPEAMRMAVARHQQLIGQAILDHHGVVVKDRGEGDSLFAVFTIPSDAVAAAVTLQLAIGREQWPTATPLRVRAAIHTGRADYREGDYYGLEVNRCARLRAIAYGGQVLLSGAAATATGQQPPPGVTTKPLGTYRLRGLRMPESVLQVLHPQLPRDFPSLPSLGVGVSVQWRTRLEEIRQELDEIASWDGELPGTQRERLRRLVSSMQRWALDTGIDYHRGRAVDARTVQLGTAIFDRLISLTSDATVLMMDVARLLEYQGDRPGALAATQRAIAATGAPRSEHLLFAGEVLMSIGEIEQAHRLLSLVEQALTGHHVPAGLLLPLTEENRLHQLFRARRFLATAIIAARQPRPTAL